MANCCQAMTAQCLACNWSVSVDEYCQQNPGTSGCPTVPMCCRAMTAQCLACDAGLPEYEYCRRNPNSPWPGCPTTPTCCQANTPICLACQQGLSVDEYCQQYPSTTGCSSRASGNSGTPNGWLIPSVVVLILAIVVGALFFSKK